MQRFYTLALAFCLLSVLVKAQDTIVDAAGNTVVVTDVTDIDGDVVPSTISTIADVPAATATTAEPETVVGTPGVAVNVPGARPTDCTTAGCPADPTTYADYYTVGGVQFTSWLTFVATTPVTPPPSPVPAGTRLRASAFEQSLSQAAATAIISSPADRSANLLNVQHLVVAFACVLVGLAVAL